MSKILLALVSTVFVATAQAQTFKVTKIQGKKAIVEVNDPNLIMTGMTYDVGGGSSKTSSKGGGKRDNGIAVDGYITSIGSPSVTTIKLDGTYLWNMKTWEAGPRFGMTSVSPGNSSSTRFGALGYYNFNENKQGVESIMAAQGGLTISSGNGSSTTQIDLGGNYRWFVLSGDHCFSFSALYEIIQYSGSSTSGFALTAGIATYF